MSKVQKGALWVSTASLAAAIVLGFQNCSKTQFTQASGGSVLKTEAEDSSATSAGDDGAIADNADTPDSTDSSHANNGGKKDRPANDDSSSQDDSASDEDQDSVVAADIVECQMLHPNRKIVLGPEIAISSSNASSSRVCMSRSACLELVNDYAVRHDCSLAAGAGQDPTEERQCTEVFPGSHGTCKNAKILNDEEVADILNLLANK